MAEFNDIWLLWSSVVLKVDFVTSFSSDFKKRNGCEYLRLSANLVESSSVSISLAKMVKNDKRYLPSDKNVKNLQKYRLL